jgi:hypothetical protein
VDIAIAEAEIARAENLCSKQLFKKDTISEVEVELLRGKHHLAEAK